MRLLISGFVLLAAVGVTEATAQVRVDGYTRKDGTYVEPHVRTRPDSNPYNNYSTQGNSNPYTGKQGTVDPYAPRDPYGSTSRRR